MDTSGIVTQRRSNGVVIQDPSPDDDPKTSEGVFVFTSAAPPAFAALGASIQVHGQVQEFRNSDTADLTVTEIGASPTLSLLSMTNPLPAAVVIGTDRTPPGAIIENDSTSSVEDPGVLFDPEQDGLDFWESLENMRVELTDAVAVGPENSFGEIQIASQGTSGTFTPRGGLILTADDANPERIVLDDLIQPNPPGVNVGDHFSSPIVGVVNYNFDNFELESNDPVTRVPGGLTRETTANVGANQVSIATFNVENLAPGDPQTKYDASGRPHRQQPEGAGHRGARGDPGQQRRDRRRHRLGHPDVREADRRDRRPAGRPDVPVPLDRPGQRPGRRPAGRQHPRRLPVPDRPGPVVHRPAGRHLDQRGQRRARPAAVVQPGPDRPRTRPGRRAASRSRRSSTSAVTTSRCS